MEIEDGAIWVHGVGEDGVQASTDFGIEKLIELVRFYKENPELLRRWQREQSNQAGGLRRMLTARSRFATLESLDGATRRPTVWEL